MTLLCTVRDCRAPLASEERRLVCARSHSFDAARSGYVNLLQPQDKRSRNPGDSREAAAARRRFLDRGFDAPLVERLAAIAATLPAGPILDVGCGEGHHLEAFRRARGGEAHGIDISTPAVDLAARRYRECAFIVANADRFLPYAGSSFAVVASITARMNTSEFRRVLCDGGRLLIAVAGADDLLEIRDAILGEGKLVDRTEAAIGAFGRDFEVQSRETIRTTARLDHPALEDVMTSSYRAMRTRERARLAAIDGMQVTLSREVIVFKAR